MVLNEEKFNWICPGKAHITGAFFQDHYDRLRAERPEADLAAVWVIDPEIVIDENPAVRRKEEAQKHPHFVHLDRLAKTVDAAVIAENADQ